MIYRLLLVSDQWIIAERQGLQHTNRTPCYDLYCYKLAETWRKHPETGWSAQFLRVCKHFHAEASQFLYGHNKFELSFATLEEAFLPTIGTRNASFIRYMEIARTGFDRSKATDRIPKVLNALPSLRCLYFTPVIETSCGNECQYFCKHTPSQLKILVLRLAYLVTTEHPHLKWLLEFKHYPSTSPSLLWYKFSDDESNKHPPRPHQHPQPQRRYWHARPRLDYEVTGDVVDVEEQLCRVKVVKVRTRTRTHRSPLPIGHRPVWRV